MNLYVCVKMSMVLYNRNSMEPLTIERKIEKKWNEESDEYKELCRRYESEIGKKRGETQRERDEYDKKVLEMSAREAKENILESVKVIGEAIKLCYVGKAAYVEYAGYIINPAEFCAIKVMEPVVEMKKE